MGVNVSRMIRLTRQTLIGGFCAGGLAVPVVMLALWSLFLRLLANSPGGVVESFGVWLEALRPMLWPSSLLLLGDSADSGWNLGLLAASIGLNVLLYGLLALLLIATLRLGRGGWLLFSAAVFAWWVWLWMVGWIDLGLLVS